MSKIRMVFYAPLLSVGGTQRHLQQVMRLLDRSRFEVVEVVTLKPGGEVEQELRRDGWRVRSLGIGSRLLGPHGVRVMASEARRLRAERVDVIQGYQWRPSLIAAVVGRLAGVPLVVAGKRSLTGASRQAQLAWRVIGRVADTIVTNADALQREAESQGVSARWHLLRNGIDTDYYAALPTSAAAKSAMGLDPSRPVVGSVGRLEARKGHPALLSAWPGVAASGSRPQLLLVGDGPLQGALRAQAAQLGVAADVHFAGEVADVRTALAAMDVFVLPSHEEGMSNALLEAMAAARPIVATRVGGTPEVLGEDGGTLVADLDTSALSGAIVQWLSDPTAAERQGQAARQLVEQRFGARVMIDRLQGLYADRLSARGRMAA